MNVLLLFAFTISFCSFMNDLIRNDLMWDDKFCLSLIASLLTFIPMLVNFFVFIKSDETKWRRLLFNVLKFTLMDEFEDFMWRRKFNNESTPYCSLSSLDRTSFYSGEILLLGGRNAMKVECEEVKLMPLFNDYKRKVGIFGVNSQFMVKYIETEYKSSSIKFPFIKFSDLGKSKCLKELISEENMVSCSDVPKDKASLFSKMLDLGVEDAAFTKEHDEYKIAFFGRNVDYVILEDDDWFTLDTHKNEITFDKLYDKRKLNKNSFTIMEMSVKDINATTKIRAKKSFKIGEIIVILEDRWVYCSYKNEFKCIYSGLNTSKFLKLERICKFLVEFPERGIFNTDRLSKDLNEHISSPYKILHCLNLQEIVAGLNDRLFIKRMPLNIYRVESNEFNEDIIYSVYTKLIGETNSQILNNLLDDYLKFDLKLKHKISTMIMNQNCGQSISSAMKFQVGNFRTKKFLAELDYFLKLIGFGNIGFCQTLNLRRDFVQACRKSNKIEKTFSVPRYSDIDYQKLACTKKIPKIEKVPIIQVSKKQMKILKSKTPLTSLKKEIDKNRNPVIEELKCDILKSYKEVLIDNCQKFEKQTAQNCVESLRSHIFTKMLLFKTEKSVKHKEEFFESNFKRLELKSKNKNSKKLKKIISLGKEEYIKNQQRKNEMKMKADQFKQGNPKILLTNKFSVLSKMTFDPNTPFDHSRLAGYKRKIESREKGKGNWKELVRLFEKQEKIMLEKNENIDYLPYRKYVKHVEARKAEERERAEALIKLKEDEERRVLLLKEEKEKRIIESNNKIVEAFEKWKSNPNVNDPELKEREIEVKKGFTIKDFEKLSPIIKFEEENLVPNVNKLKSAGAFFLPIKHRHKNLGESFLKDYEKWMVSACRSLRKCL